MLKKDKVFLHFENAGGARPPDEVLKAREEDMAKTREAMAHDPNVALGFSPPPHRSALANRNPPESINISAVPRTVEHGTVGHAGVGYQRKYG
jgi:hypothetical protein